MKTALVVVGVIVLMAAAAVGGFYFGASSGGSITLPGVGTVSVGPGGQAQAGQFQPGQFPQGQFDPSQMTEEQRQQFQQQFGQGRQDRQGGTTQAGAVRALGGGAFGTIESIENGIIVVKTQSATMTVKTTDTTLIEKQMSVDVSQLEVGDQISVSGSQGEDGVTTARSIRVLSAPAAGQ